MQTWKETQPLIAKLILTINKGGRVMTNRTIKSNGVTFVDMSDKRKLEVHISSNLPTVQIYDNNTKNYTPDWSTTNLILEARVYLDAHDITNKITTFTWKGAGGTSSGATYVVKSNVLSSTASIQTYSCEVVYDGLTARSQMDFTRVANGSNGTSVRILGSYDTVAELQAAHPNGNTIGDSYLVKGVLYVWNVEKNAWVSSGNITGPAGYTPIKGIDYRDGVDGQDGKDGVSIVWKGDLSTPPSSPKLNWVYRNTTDHTVQIYNGTNWELMVLDGSDGANGTPGSNGLSVFITYNDSATTPSIPTGNGTTNGWHTNATTSAIWMSQKVAENATSGTWGAPIKIKGENGTTYYTWIKYADTPTSGMSDLPDGKTYMGIAYNKTTATESTNYSDYTWALIKGANGVDGANGRTYYTWVRYADDINGTNMSDSPNGKSYIGLAYNKSTATESNVASDYQWSLFKGADGINGQTYYVHIRYSANADGSGMTATPQSNTQYLGTCSTTSGTAPTTNTSYTWALIKGSTGASGANGTNGTSYYVHIRYKEFEESTTLLTTPSNYMGVYSGTSSTAPTTINSYTWYNTKGDVGAPGEAAVTFQVYSENGYILSKDTQRITLQTFAYVGDTKITADATYQWYTVSNGVDTAIVGATEPSYDVVHSDIEFRNVYKCIMTFNNIEYVGLATLEDKNDIVTTFTTKPTSYSAGDIWVVGTDISASDMPEGASYGEILKAEHANTVYSKDDWIPATKYDQLLKDLKKTVDEYDQFFTFNSDTGLSIRAIDQDGNASQFSTTLSNDRLSFNEGTNSIAYISGSKMHIKEAEILSPLTVTGSYSGNTMQQAPTINIGGFSIVVEANGSLSIISNN